jgi:hypothetical protein
MEQEIRSQWKLPMTFDEVLEQVRELLQSKGRVAYRALKRRFELDDTYLEDLKAELIDTEHVAYDEDGKVLVWRGSTTVRRIYTLSRRPATHRFEVDTPLLH